MARDRQLTRELEVAHAYGTEWRYTGNQGYTSVPQDKQALPKPPGKEIEVERGDSWAERSLRSHLNRSWSPSVSPNKPISAWIKTYGDVTHWMSRVRSLDLSTLPSYEVEHVEKFTIFGGGTPRYDIVPEGYVTEGKSSDVIDLGVECLRILFSLSDWPFGRRPTHLLKGYPNDSNGGPPHGQRGRLSFVMDMLAARATWNTDFHEGYKKYASLLGNTLPFHVSVTPRAKATRKPVPIYESRGDTVYHVADSYAVCDERRAYSQSRFGNKQTLRGIDGIKRLLKSHRITAHSTPESTIQYLRSVEASGGQGGTAQDGYSGDLSGFDKNVSRYLQTRLRDHIYKEVMTPYELEVYDAQHLCPILGGPFGGDNLFLYDKIGQLSSGTYGTSVDGILANLVLVFGGICVSADWSPVKTVVSLLRREWGGLFWGDDRVICLPKDLDREKFQTAQSDAGIQETTDEAKVFLMRVYRKNASGQYIWHPVGSRIMQNSLSPEDAPFNRTYRSAVALLGLENRTQNAEYSELWPQIEPWIVGKESPLWNKGLRALRQFVQTPEFLKQLAA